MTDPIRPVKDAQGQPMGVVHRDVTPANAAAREQRPSSAAELSALFTAAAAVAPASEAEVSTWVQALMVEVGELKPRSEESTRSVEAPTAPR